MLLKILVCGVALASLWFWIFTLIRKELTASMLKWWLRVIVPQGIMIIFALVLMGII
jgi:hypothetical protein